MKGQRGAEMQAMPTVLASCRQPQKKHNRHRENVINNVEKKTFPKQKNFSYTFRWVDNANLVSKH